MYPVLFESEYFRIMTYWVFVGTGITAGFITLLWAISPLNRERKLSTVVFAAAIFVPFIIGARAGYILECFFTGKIIHSFGLSGPVSLWWGLLLATAAAFPMAKIFDVDVWETADIYSLSISIGGIFTRIGCLFNGCCFGIPCSHNNLLGTFFSPYSPAYSVYGSVMLHPTQLYSSLSWLIIFITLLNINKKKHFKGELILVMSFMYGIFRFLIEFLRYHEHPAFLSQAQIISLIIILLSWFLYNKLKL